MLSKLWAKEAYPSKLIDEHFASNTALKRAIIKKKLYRRASRWDHARPAKRASHHSTFYSADKIY